MTNESTWRTWQHKQKRLHIKETLYKITKQVCGKFRSITTAPIKNKEGQLLTSETAQEARWTEHFNEVLNRPAPETEPDIKEAEEDLDNTPEKRGNHKSH
ncbi:hypothetical protein RRG08_023267 [Elysia crispata]|uniref:Uncharacterized protein n=1 Tax=Elysia crispata TaxID=231223 RepID=A0AAE0ZYZ1_9GAST|nr:hypothetical protein RRG08_023267 [Elysia crispata]